ncbi:hypothetical protein [Bradyrhizobium sp. LTSP849]|uniref:hypothetical protein n=1 Tax=Bradyrhizobium sp. LTSP849 TaxID=1615890 RepID=UPI001AEC679D|nr:hypothetical protein [Bradyrhizobium sp. LTSP849]
MTTVTTGAAPGRCQLRQHWPIPEKESRIATGTHRTDTPFETLNMRRSTPSATGTKFTVRGQVYIQAGAFFHAMSNEREVRVLELETICPDCSQPFQATASMRQIKTRQLVRRCPPCRKIHTGPVSIAKPVARKRAKKKAPGRKMPAASRRPVARKFEPPSQTTLLEIRPVDVRQGETPAAAMQRALSGVLDGAAEPPADLAQRQWCDASGMLD